MRQVHTGHLSLRAFSTFKLGTMPLLFMILLLLSLPFTFC